MIIAYWKTSLRAALLVLLAGCGDAAGRQALQGSVTLDGEPLPKGVIQFVPLPGTNGPTAGGEIQDGRFSIKPDKGVFSGVFRVDITASRKTGEKVIDRISGEMTDAHAQFLPDRYNRRSELTAEVQEGGPNRFEFTLSSK